MKHIRTPLLIAIITLLLGSCGFNESTKNEELTPEVSIEVSGAKSSVFAAILTSQTPGVQTGIKRPSSPLGMYVSMFLAQERIFPAKSALEGIDVQIKLFMSDESIERDESFALLEEYGSVLQVDITDALNRSIERERTLDQYLRSLERMNKRVAEKEEELKQKREAVEDERREQRKKVKDVERDIRSALKEKDYAAAGPKQKELTELEGELAETETKEKQLKKVLKVYKTLLEIGLDREEAISKNREPLLAGLKVIDVPGVEDLGIVIEE